MRLGTGKISTILLALALTASACASDAGEDRQANENSTATGAGETTPDSDSGVADGESVKVAAVASLTGPYAGVGVPEGNGFELAMKHVNEDGGIDGRELEVIIEDDGSDVQQGISLVSQFASQDDVLMFVGITSSSVGIPAVPIANDEELPYLGLSIAPDNVTAGPWSTKLLMNPEAVTPSIAEAGVERGIESVALVAGQGNDTQIAMVDAAREVFEGSNVEIVLDEKVDLEQTDYTSVATSIAQSEPDAVFTSVTPEQSASLWLQALEAGLPTDTLLMGSQSIASPVFLEFGGEAVEGAIVGADYFAGLDTEENERFVEAYTEQYGDRPDQWSGVGYASIMLAANALRDAQDAGELSRENVRDALMASSDVPTIIGEGTLSFDDEGFPVYQPVLLEIRDDEFEVYDG